jgi:uncharacterized protein (DUF2236 family)
MLRRPETTKFLEPAGEPALVPPDSVSWRIFKNPVTLFIGGVAAVILELAEPAVRTGVWEHTGFRRDPVRRLERTGLAAMVTVYAARSVAESMIANVVRLHDKVTGLTPAGEPYRANDPKLLRWVQATAAYGFIEAYNRFGRALTPAEIDQAYAEGAPAAALYGAHDAPHSDAERQALFDAMRVRLEPSPIISEFLQVMRAAPIVPWPLRPVQRLLIRAAVELTPGWVRERLGLDASVGLLTWQRPLVGWLGALADRMVLPFSPAVQSCRRLGRPAGYLYRRRGTG